MYVHQQDVCSDIHNNSFIRARSITVRDSFRFMPADARKCSVDDRMSLIEVYISLSL